MDAAAMLDVRDVAYRYRASPQPALCGVSLQVQRGHIYGLLGPNGAGKTTLIALLCGLLPMQQGRIALAGADLHAARKACPSAVAVVPQDYAFYPMLTVYENLRFFAGVQGMGGALRAQRIEASIAFCRLQNVARQRAHTLSGGLRRRLNLAIGLLGQPQLLLLDEPTVGVDPQSRHFLLDSIASLRAAGTTIVYTSHYMHEVQTLCDALAIIDHGRLLVQGSLDEILSGAAQHMALRLHQGLAPQLAAQWQERYALQSTAPNSYTLHVQPQELPVLLAQLAQADCGVAALSYGQPNLEQVFMQLTQRQLRD